MTQAQLRRIIIAFVGLIGIVVISATALKQCMTTKLVTNPASNPGYDSGTDNRSERSQPSSVDPNYTEPAEVTEWEHHALVLQGENLLPVKEAFATEGLTIFNLEPGYMPVQPMGRIDEGNGCYKKWYAPDRAAGVNVISESATDAAEDSALIGQTARNIYEAIPGCPRDLGAVEAGAYIFDANGTNLAGFDFTAPIHPFEVVSMGNERFIVLPEGGDKTKKDPAITQLKLRSILVEPHSELKVKDREVVAKEILRIVNSGVNSSDVEFFPRRDEFNEEEEFDEAYVEAIQNEIEVLIKRRSKDPQNRGNQNSGDGAFDGIFVHIRTQSYSSTELAEQQRRREAKIKKALDDIQRKIDTVIKTVSFGDEIPACIQNSPACWSANRSVSIYSR